MDRNEKSVSSPPIPTVKQHESHNTPTICPRLTCRPALSPVRSFAFSPVQSVVLDSDLFEIAICCSLVSRGASGICHTLHFTFLTNHNGVTPTINAYFSLTVVNYSHPNPIQTSR